MNAGTQKLWMTSRALRTNSTRLLTGQVEHGHLGALALGAVELGVDAGLVDVGVDVVEVPAPLLGDDADREVLLRARVDEPGLVTRGVVEEDGHHEDGDDRVEHLHRHVVAQLDGKRLVALALAEADGGVEHQAPRDGAHGQDGDPAADPEVGDPLAAVGDHRGQVSVGHLSLAAAEGQRPRAPAIPAMRSPVRRRPVSPTTVVTTGVAAGVSSCSGTRCTFRSVRGRAGRASNVFTSNRLGSRGPRRNPTVPLVTLSAGGG